MMPLYHIAGISAPCPRLNVITAEHVLQILGLSRGSMQRACKIMQASLFERILLFAKSRPGTCLKMLRWDMKNVCQASLG